MGFHRERQPPALARAGITAAVLELLTAQDVAEAIGPADPFRLVHDCINPAGHDAIAACGEVVCCHCAKVFWR